MDSRKKEVVLSPEHEYRFELDPGISLAIKLVQGQAEIFGAELTEGVVYLFGSECKAAVFTWKGCVLEMSPFRLTNILDKLIIQYVVGHPPTATDYVSEDTPMAAYGNVHIAFEQMRVRALRKIHGSPVPDHDANAPTDPPRVLIVGPENSGKTTVAKILVNYAVRAGQRWAPLLVNVDPSEGALSVPGTLAVAAIPDPIPTYSPANPLGSAATSAPTTMASSALTPLVYWYGHPEIKRNPLLYERIVRNMGETIHDRFMNDPEGSCSGLIVDTPSSFASGAASNTDIRQKLIKACIEAFRINVILIVGHEKLNVELQRAYGSSITVVKIPKSGGVAELDHGFRERAQSAQFHSYMYGHIISPPKGINNGTLGGEPLLDQPLAPASTIINFDDLSIYRIGAASMAPSSALPIGAARAVSELQPVRIDPASPGSGLLNGVLALLAPFHPDENERYDEEILDLSVIGFLYVTHIDIPNKKMTILSPNPSSVTGKTALFGSFEVQEH